MSIFRIIGIVLLIIGIAMIATGSFQYREKKKILDTNSVDISATEKRTVTWPRIAGVVVAVGGIVLIVMGDKGKANAASKTAV